MTAILGIGECMIELTAHDCLAVSNQFHRHVGGDVYNTLVRAVNTLAPGACAMLTRLGADGFGAVIRNHFAAHGVSDTWAIATQDALNGLYFNALQPDGSHEFIYYRAHSAASLLSPADFSALPLDTLKSNGLQYVYATGITQGISLTARQTVQTAFETSRKMGLGVAYDPNFRARLWPKRDQALEAFTDIVPFITVLLPSWEDLQRLYNWDSLDHALDYFRWRDVPLTVIKNGEQGVTVQYVTGRKVVRFSREAHWVSTICDTVGAGDAFNGGFLAALTKGADLENAVDSGLKTAAACLGHFGALPQIENTNLAP